MNQHDPYLPMIEELRRLNDNDTDDQFYESLHQSQQFVTNLRLAYRNSPSNVDFSCRHTRAAYLLAYYPNYIEPIYEILTRLYEQEPEIVEKVFGFEKLRGLFLGSGPAPEVLGWLAFINENFPHVDIVTAYLLDKYIHGWRTGQELTRYHLAPIYWPEGQLTMQPMEFDFLDPDTLEDPFVQRAIGISDMIVMQNCLNDQLENRQDVLKMLINIFRQAEIGTLFVISDLNYQAIRDLMREFSNSVVDQGLGTVLLPVYNHPQCIYSKVIVPRIICDHLLTGEEHLNLIPRRRTYFYSLVLRRTEEIPF